MNTSPSLDVANNPAKHKSMRMHHSTARALLLGVGLLAAAVWPTSAITITENTDPTHIADENSIACINGSTGNTNDNTYYRAFSFNSFGIANGFAINQVQFGIEFARNSTGVTPLTLSIYAGTNLAALGVPLASLVLAVGNQSLSLFNAAIAAVVPQSANGFIVSIFSPATASARSNFIIGSNYAGQSAPSYIQAPSCGVNSPTDLAAIGASSMDIVMSVTGTSLAAPLDPVAVGVPDLGATWLLLLIGCVAVLVVQRRFLWQTA